jgi:hypothetical protein
MNLWTAGNDFGCQQMKTFIFGLFLLSGSSGDWNHQSGPFFSEIIQVK